MDRKRKADGNESPDIVSPDMDISDNLDESMSSNMVVDRRTPLSKLVESAGATACQNPAVTALLSMAAEDVWVASTISTLAILKRRGLENKQLPEYPLGLDAVSLKELRSLQMKRNKLANEYSVNLREARRDYLQKMSPLYQRRNEIVAGVTENDEGVPDFWLSALLGNTYLDNEIAKKDEQALKYLMNINCYKTDAPERTVKLEFVFDSSNPYFENTVLTKVIYFKKGENVVDRTEGTSINWKEGKCLNPMYKISGREQGYHLKSFFNFFRSSDELDLVEDRLATMKLHAHTAQEIETVMPHAYTLYMDTKAYGKLGMDTSKDEDAGSSKP